MIKRKNPKSYWKSSEVSDLLMELYVRAFRYNPHGFEIYCNRFNSKCRLVLHVNLFYTKNPNEQKFAKWCSCEYDSLTDLICSNMVIDL